MTTYKGPTVVTHCFRHSQADLRAFLELPPPLVAHRAAADVAVLDEIVKGLARLAGVGNLQGLMTLDGAHKGSFETYAGGLGSPTSMTK